MLSNLRVLGGHRWHEVWVLGGRGAARTPCGTFAIPGQVRNDSQWSLRGGKKPRIAIALGDQALDTIVQGFGVRVRVHLCSCLYKTS